MTITLIQAYNNLTSQQIQNALNAGLLSSGAAIILYLFFGRLYSLPQLISKTLKNQSGHQARKSLIVISGIVFLSALIRILYHQHLIAKFPFQTQSYLSKISTMKLIISGSLVGLGYQLCLQKNQNTGILGPPQITKASFLHIIIVMTVGSWTASNNIADLIPSTPRIIQMVNKSLPNNISFDAILLISMIIPFVGFIFSQRKSFKGLIECLLYFLVGICTASFCIFMGISNSQQSLANLKASNKWRTVQLLIIYSISIIAFTIVYYFVKYFCKKPVFSNKLQDVPVKITLKLIIGYILIGVGLGIGGMLFQTFLLIIPSGQMRILVFWGVPCLFTLRAAQVFRQRSKTVQELKKQE